MTSKRQFVTRVVLQDFMPKMVFFDDVVAVDSSHAWNRYADDVTYELTGTSSFPKVLWRTGVERIVDPFDRHVFVSQTKWRLYILKKKSVRWGWLFQRSLSGVSRHYSGSSKLSRSCKITSDLLQRPASKTCLKQTESNFSSSRQNSHTNQSFVSAEREDLPLPLYFSTKCIEILSFCRLTVREQLPLRDLKDAR